MDSILIFWMGFGIFEIVQLKIWGLLGGSGGLEGIVLSLRNKATIWSLLYGDGGLEDMCRMWN